MKRGQFYSARWWSSSDCTIEPVWMDIPDLSDEIDPIKWGTVDCFVPGGDHHLYDPFEFYYQSGTNDSDHREKSLHYEFANLNPEDQGAVYKFCRRFGVPGPFRRWTWETFNETNVPLEPTDQPQIINDCVIISPQQRLRVVAKTPHGRIPDPSVLRPQPVDHVKDECYKLKTCLSLVTAINKQRLPDEWHRDPRNAGLFRGWLRPIPTTLEEARDRLEEFLAAESATVRWTPRYQEQVKCLNMVWESLSLTSLMYLMVALDLQGQGNVRTCENCRLFFLSERRDKRHCSYVCQNRMKSKRHSVHKLAQR